jgi:hypothetical protein
MFWSESPEKRNKTDQILYENIGNLRKEETTPRQFGCFWLVSGWELKKQPQFDQSQARIKQAQRLGSQDLVLSNLFFLWLPDLYLKITRKQAIWFSLSQTTAAMLRKCLLSASIVQWPMISQWKIFWTEQQFRLESEPELESSISPS